MEQEALSVALDAISRVGSFVRRVRPELTPEDFITKEDGSPVTVADLGAQALLVRFLREDDRIPRVPICGEEESDLLRTPGNEGLLARVHQLVRSEQPDMSEDDVLELIDQGSFRPEPRSRSTHWICDPIDGTKRYISGHRYSCCLGLVVDGRLCTGAIACPDLGGRSDDPLDQPHPVGSVFGTCIDRGSFWVEGLSSGSSGDRHAIEPLASPDGRKRLLVARSVGGTSLRPILRDGLVKVGFNPVVVNIDNQCKYVALVSGRADVLFQYGDGDSSKCSWDFAPGVLLAREAGGAAQDRGGRDFDFDQGPYLLANRGLRASHPDLIELLLSVR